MTKYLIFILSIAILSACQSDDTNKLTEEYPSYNIQLQLDPEKQEIKVIGSFEFKNNLELKDSLFFYLNKNLNIDYFTVNQIKNFGIDNSKSDISYIPQSVKISFGSNQNFSQTDLIKVSFSYSGKLGFISKYSANVMNSDWVEMGLYYPWFPYNPQLRPFTYKLNLKIDPAYKIAGLGDIIQENGKWIITNQTPTNDLVICASRDVLKHETMISQTKLSIFHHDFNDTLLTKISKDIDQIMGHYYEWFGEKKQDISIIQSKRKKGGGYARIGGVFLGGFKPEQYFLKNEGYHRYFAHELAHLWWYKAPTTTWEDWLNESFAEYSALMIIREVFGEEAFDLRLNDKKMKLENSPAIWNFNRSTSKYSTLLLYNKGPVLLSELENQLGKDDFIKLCRTILNQNVKTTKNFLEILKQFQGEEIALDFEKKLKS